ncbi:RluA family pseudouridine synthase [Hydrogenimonas sp.]
MDRESLTRLRVDGPQRLDRFLHRHIGGSRNQVERLIKKGFVEVDGRPVTKAGLKLKGGEEVAYRLPPEPDYERAAVDFDVPVIYEDDDILVVNKPSGLVVHPAPSVKEATLVDWLKARGVNLSTLSGEERHGIVHRLDKETSGALVVAKNNPAHERLSAQLQNKTMGRYYVALVDYPLKASCTVEAPIARNPANRLKMGVVAGGRAARTRFEKLLSDEEAKVELVGAKLFTGRTHQIRVHLESLGRHIVGDRLYGFKSKSDRISRILLHAYILYLDHPTTGRPMRFEAAIPEDMMGVLRGHFDKERLDEILDTDTFLRRFGDGGDGLCHERGDDLHR